MNKAVVAVLIACGIGGVLYWIASRGPEGAHETVAGPEVAQPEEPVRYYVPVSDEQPSVGPENALVTIVEFSDFQCVYCARMVGTLDGLRERYGDDVRIVWRNMPADMHPHAEIASRLAMEAYEQGGNEGFWKMHDALFEHIEEGLDEETLREIARKLRFDATPVLEGDAQMGVVREDIELGVKLGLPGTPVYFVNGVQVQGAIPRPMFRAIVDQELANAKAMVGSGVAPGDVYQQIIEGGQKEARALPPGAEPLELEEQAR